MTDDPFERWEEIKVEIKKFLAIPDPEPADWLDELEREREDGRVWQLTQGRKRV